MKQTEPTRYHGRLRRAERSVPPVLLHETGYDVRKFLISIATLCLLAGCSGLGVLNTLTTDDGYAVASNIPYDNDTGQSLDLYNIRGSRNLPVVIFLYGGRWSQGSKDDFKFVGQALTSQGFITVIPDYRKYPQARFPTFVQDAAKAVKWTRDNIARYGGDPNRIFVMGHSAGAHIAAMLALNGDYLKAVGGSRSWLKGMIGLAGPYDFLPLTAPDLRDLFGPPDRYEQSQPILFVDGKNPPLLLLHAEDDQTVLVKNTRNLARAVAAAGGPVETLIYPKVGCPAFNSHSCILATIAAPLRRQSDVLAGITDFIRRRSGLAPQRPDVSPDAEQTLPLTESAPLPEPQPLQIETEPQGQPQPVPVNP
ncbi:MAG: alpha/beta hydrolase [Nevskiaceae bacterium]|nr:MAG: alpha/beta hydrolase [Nevskiaceae bacterium]